MLAAGVRVVATDFNPGPAPSYHLLAMTLACLNQAMTPQEALMGPPASGARAYCTATGLTAAGQRRSRDHRRPVAQSWLHHSVLTPA
jgi:imidazolonepropionase-like amidohydrolase